VQKAQLLAMTLKRLCSCSDVAALRVTHLCHTLHFVKGRVSDSGFASHSLDLLCTELNLTSQSNMWVLSWSFWQHRATKRQQLCKRTGNTVYFCQSLQCVHQSGCSCCRVFRMRATTLVLSFQVHRHLVPYYGSG